MGYAGLQMFMGYLKQLINRNDIPVIHNNSLILSERPQFQLLYEELASIIQTISSIHHQHHQLQKVTSLKTRFNDVAEDAQDIIDLFLSAVHFTNRGLSPTRSGLKTSLDLENVMRSIQSIKVEFMTNNMKMDYSPRIDSHKIGSTSSDRNLLESRKPLEETVVGLVDETKVIVERLIEDRMQLDVVSIVGMGGLGKTTLATKVFNDPFVVYLYLRVWVTVSQTYKKRDLLIQILTSIGVQQDLENDNDSKLREKLHKNLMGRRYLIVIDDIWSIEAWDDLKLLFPNENTKSRILLTSRLNEVALHAKPNGFVHSLSYLTEEQSWELMKKKVFHGDECPNWVIEPGMQIAKKCQGLPLSVVVIAGVLAKEEMNKDSWGKIARSVGSYIVNDQKGCLETLALSYHHLPAHLRECFLYLGGFPEDFRINVERLIWLWVAEGFIEERGNRSLENAAKAYLIDLVDRNLVIVAERKFNGDVKACKLHDLVRELCLDKAKEESFFLRTDQPTLPSPVHKVMTSCGQRRVFKYQDIKIVDFAHPPVLSMRSLFCFSKYTSLSYDISEYFFSFALLRVLDLQKYQLDCYFPMGISLLVHLRYLAIWHSRFPPSICNLWSLQTLVLKTNQDRVVLPSNISDLVNLRHLWSSTKFYLPSIGKPMNLQSISDIMLGEGVDNFGTCFPGIRKLACTFYSNEECCFELPPYLETLKLRGCFHRNQIWLPASLIKLTLVSCLLPWSDMSIIQSLPNLEVLKLKGDAFMGRKWDACEQLFRKLKFLTLEKLDIEQWEAYSTSFPCLKRLAVWYCNDLEGIPLEIGEIPTLELIETHGRNHKVVTSVERIREEQHDAGNTELQIILHEMESPFYSSAQWKDDDKTSSLDSFYLEYDNEIDP